MKKDIKVCKITHDQEKIDKETFFSTQNIIK